MDLITYRAFTARLQQNLEADPRVIGLVALGSMAEIGRLPDTWSDHDFFVVTIPGAQEDFRQNLDWLPDVDQIVLRIRETAHGLKVLYTSGHLLEFAVFDETELEPLRANDYRVLLDRGSVEPLMQAAAARSRPLDDPAPYDPAHDFSMVISLLLVGAGRYARGEQLSAHIFIKDYALRHLLPLLTRILASEPKSALDSLDPFRRFELVFPDAGAAINHALILPPLDCARALLDLTVEYAQPVLTDFPADAVETVREYLARGHLVDLLARDRVHIFGPRNFNTRLHLTYKMVRQAIQIGVDIVGFAIEPERLIWHRQHEIYENVVEMSSWQGSFADSWRKILAHDEEIAAYFEVIEDGEKRILTRVITRPHL